MSPMPRLGNLDRGGLRRWAAVRGAGRVGAVVVVVGLGAALLVLGARAEASSSPARNRIPEALPGAPALPEALRERLAGALEARGAGYVPRTKNLHADGLPIYTNRLLLEVSPYLQQHAQKHLSATPHYETLDEQGPDHSKCFEVSVRIAQQRFPSAWGPSKKEAEQKAAYAALRELDLTGDEEPGFEVADDAPAVGDHTLDQAARQP